jgi:hypothetical protein
VAWTFSPWLFAVYKQRIAIRSPFRPAGSRAGTHPGTALLALDELLPRNGPERERLQQITMIAAQDPEHSSASRATALRLRTAWNLPEPPGNLPETGPDRNPESSSRLQNSLENGRGGTRPSKNQGLLSAGGLASTPATGGVQKSQPHEETR